ncbi:UNVERIFIED_CONTAM: hypothetical protein Scaly_1663100, partial [Sesamum calycinum]
MLFDGVARSDGAGAGVVFVSAEKQILTYSIVLSELCSNNITDYQALIIDLQMALEMGIMEMEVYGDSKLIINQLLDIYEVKKDDLVLPSLDTSYHENSNAITIATNDDEDWRTPRMEYLKHVFSWRFDAWGLDVMGPITPKSSARHVYILAATDYFSKWTEAISLKEVKKEIVVDFICVNIIFQYGVPR